MVMRELSFEISDRNEEGIEEEGIDEGDEEGEQRLMHKPISAGPFLLYLTSCGITIQKVLIVISRMRL